MKTPLEVLSVSITSFLLSFLLNKLLLQTNFLQTAFQQNTENRWASRNKPPIGGFSFYVVFLCNLIWLDRSWQFLVFPFTFIFFWGLMDDFLKMPPLLKFIGQASLAGFFIVHGDYITISDNDSINKGFTFFWIVGIMNSMNMLDNMDGVLASTTLIILFATLLLVIEQVYTEAYEIGFVMSLMAAIAGFLYFNWSPAKMFMGDSGSQFLGAFLAWLSIKYFWGFRSQHIEGVQLKQFLVPILVFTIPLVDTSTVIFHRLRRGLSPFIGGKDHLAHHLVYAGFSEKDAVKFLCILSMFSGMIVFFIGDVVGTNMWISSNTTLVVIYWVLVWLILQILYERGIHRSKM